MPERNEPPEEPVAELAEPAAERFGGLTLGVFVVALIAGALFIALLVLVDRSTPEVLRLDRNIANRMHRIALSDPAFTRAMQVISNLGSTLAWWIILVPVVAWLAYRRAARLAIFVVVTVAGSSILNGLVKFVVGRARPHLDDPVAVAAGKSFPSGHSQAAIVGYGLLLVVFLPIVAPRWRRWLVAFAVLAVLAIGFSRIALGVHYLSDVIGAYLIGAVWLIGMITALRLWRQSDYRLGRGAP
ncbi:MAG: putative rane protein [Frankiales bacterium]|nr:putative rane protein [Frankiales bacterium]